MYFSLPLRAASTHFGSFVTFSGVFSTFYFKQNKRLTKNGSNFWTPCFWFSQRKVETVLWGSLKNNKNPLKTRCILVPNVGTTMFFLLHNRSGLPMRERLYSVSAMIVTINGGMDDTHYAANFGSKFHGRCSQTNTPSVSITSDVLGLFRYDGSIKRVLFDSFKIIASYMIQQPKPPRKFIFYVQACMFWLFLKIPSND